jgi:DNA-binding LacI/PurR family transcriptional regulator
VRPGERGPAAPRQIIVLFRDLSGPHTLEVVRGIVDAADESRVDVVTEKTGHRSISQWLEECVALGAAGLILVISMLAEDDQRRIVEQRLPVELADPPRGASRPSPTSCRPVLLPSLA